jgi:glyoxylase-like metal-dependent hydrolase (beta-lactamase superfamily II)
MAVRMYADPADYEGLEYDRLVGEGDRLPLGELTLCVYATPGHSKGGICVDCGDVLFTGDTLFAGEVGRTDLEGGDYVSCCAPSGGWRSFPGTASYIRDMTFHNACG